MTDKDSKGSLTIQERWRSDDEDGTTFEILTPEKSEEMRKARLEFDKNREAYGRSANK